jgi:hypothetical protein
MRGVWRALTQSRAKAHRVRHKKPRRIAMSIATSRPRASGSIPNLAKRHPSAKRHLSAKRRPLARRHLSAKRRPLARRRPSAKRHPLGKRLPLASHHPRQLSSIVNRRKLSR